MIKIRILTVLGIAAGLAALAVIAAPNEEVMGQSKDKDAVVTGSEQGREMKAEQKPQTTCPIMGGKVQKDLFRDVKGHRVYVCCKGCLARVEKNPDQALKTIRKNGETPQKLQDKSRVESRACPASSMKNTCSPCR